MSAMLEMFDPLGVVELLRQRYGDRLVNDVATSELVTRNGHLPVIRLEIILKPEREESE